MQEEERKKLEAEASFDSPKTSISDSLLALVEVTRGEENIRFSFLLKKLHEQGFGMVMAIFVLPCCIPVPVAGVTLFLALPLLYIAVQMLWGMQAPWFPPFIGRRGIRHETLESMITRILPYVKKIEKIMHPRLTFFFSPRGERVLALFWLIFALSISIPVPATNFVPAIGILLISLALLSHDGLLAIAGIITGIIGCVITTGIMIGAVWGVQALSEYPWLQKFVGEW